MRFLRKQAAFTLVELVLTLALTSLLLAAALVGTGALRQDTAFGSALDKAVNQVRQIQNEALQGINIRTTNTAQSGATSFGKLIEFNQATPGVMDTYTLVLSSDGTKLSKCNLEQRKLDDGVVLDTTAATKTAVVFRNSPAGTFVATGALVDTNPSPDSCAAVADAGVTNNGPALTPPPTPPPCSEGHYNDPPTCTPAPYGDHSTCPSGKIADGTGNCITEVLSITRPGDNTVVRNPSITVSVHIPNGCEASYSNHFSLKAYDGPNVTELKYGLSFASTSDGSMNYTILNPGQASFELTDYCNGGLTYADVIHVTYTPPDISINSPADNACVLVGNGNDSHLPISITAHDSTTTSTYDLYAEGVQIDSNVGSSARTATFQEDPHKPNFLSFSGNGNSMNPTQQNVRLYVADHYNSSRTSGSITVRFSQGGSCGSVPSAPTTLAPYASPLSAAWVKASSVVQSVVNVLIGQARADTSCGDPIKILDPLNYGGGCPPFTTTAVHIPVTIQGDTTRHGTLDINPTTGSVTRTIP